MTQALFVYRDAADQRWSLLAAANAHLEELTGQLEASRQLSEARTTESMSPELRQAADAPSGQIMAADGAPATSD